MVKPLSAVGKHCGYMLNTEFTQVLQLCAAFIFFPHVFLSIWGVICCCCCFFYIFLLSSQGTTRSRGIYLPKPDPIIMEEWAKEMGGEKSEVKEDEDHV